MQRPTTSSSSSQRPTTASSSSGASGGGAPPGPISTDAVLAKLDPAFLALSRLRRRQFDSCISTCEQVLAQQPFDRAVHHIKTQALTLQAYIDDTDQEEDGIAEVLLDDHAMSKTPRPGTSMKRPATGAAGGPPGTAAGANWNGINSSVRPMTGSGRPLTGFARPGTQNRGASRSGTSMSAESAFQGARPGTSRPISVAGRYVRLGTQSMLSDGGMFINPDRLDMAKIARRPMEARVIADYLIYHDRNFKKALELAAEATKVSDFKDWWWKARLGKCYYQLGLFREAEAQFKSSLKHQEMISAVLELCKIYVKLDQPTTALDTLTQATEKYPGDTSLILGIARIYDALYDLPRGVQYYKKVLHYDSSNVEAIACLANHHFYTDQPEIALRYYRRLLQMGVYNTELWTNLGLCCFYASQYDMTLSCFDKALAMASDDNMADVWYNIGQVAIGIGDLNLAYQAFKIAISVDANHAESFNNLGILELRKGNIEAARSNFVAAHTMSPHLFEPFFNAALVAFKLGDCQESFDKANKALEAYAEHSESKELLKQLKKHFTML